MPRDEAPSITPSDLLRAYSLGFFPMARERDDDQILWVRPDKRGVIPLHGLKISRSLKKRVRNAGFEVSVDRDFDAVIAACAEETEDRPETWINRPIETLYRQLAEIGFAHSVEVRREGALVGGLYGIALGSAFFGESMFSRETDASKVALVHLVARLNAAGYRVLDAQFINPHIARLGAVEIDRSVYEGVLDEALTTTADFAAAPIDHCDAAFVLSLAASASAPSSGATSVVR
ncbi:MAG: leucyl/phenylalanyl-tRNA--protein transferase [Pseudomonadota bacterium]